MDHLEMNRQIQQFILSWGEELKPEDRAPSPLTGWVAKGMKTLETEG